MYGRAIGAEAGPRASLYREKVNAIITFDDGHAFCVHPIEVGIDAVARRSLLVHCHLRPVNFVA
jgi:hypothetical protein